MAFPPAHLLVGIGVAELVRTAAPLPRWRAWLAAGTLAMLPDVDIVVDLILRDAANYHGTFTHSLVVTAAVGLLAATFLGWRWGALAAAGYGSHLLVDLLDDRGRTNALIGWPFTDQQPFAIARIFPQVPFEHGGGVINAALSLLDPPVLRPLLAQTAVAAVLAGGMMVLAVVIRAVLRLRRRGRVRTAAQER